MLVEIIKGTYGYKPAPGKPVRPVSRGGQLELEKAEALRLINLGIAVKVECTETESGIPDEKTSDTGVNLSEDKKAQEKPSVKSEEISLEEAGKVYTKSQLAKMSFAELKSIARELEIDGVTKLKSKEALVNAILSADEIEDTDDLPFDLTAEDPE